MNQQSIADACLAVAETKVRLQERKLQSLPSYDTNSRDEQHVLHSMRQNASTIKTVRSMSEYYDDA